MQRKGFSHHVSRSQMGVLYFDGCLKCKETVIRTRVQNTQQDQIFDPKPVGGSEMDPAYSLHVCRKS